MRACVCACVSPEDWGIVGRLLASLFAQALSSHYKPHSLCSQVTFSQSAGSLKQAALRSPSWRPPRLPFALSCRHTCKVTHQVAAMTHVCLWGSGGRRGWRVVPLTAYRWFAVGWMVGWIFKSTERNSDFIMYFCIRIYLQCCFAAMFSTTVAGSSISGAYCRRCHFLAALMQFNKSVQSFLVFLTNLTFKADICLSSSSQKTNEHVAPHLLMMLVAMSYLSWPHAGRGPLPKRNTTPSICDAVS